LKPYLLSFAFEDFLTPQSGLIQIRKYAELENNSNLLDTFKEFSLKKKLVKEKMYRLLVRKFGYFWKKQTVSPFAN